MQQMLRFIFSGVLITVAAGAAWAKNSAGIVRLARQQSSLETSGKVRDADVDRADVEIADVRPLGKLTEQPAPSLAKRPLRRLGTIEPVKLASEVEERILDLELCRARVARAAGVPVQEVKAGKLSLRWTILPSGGTRGTLVLERSATELALMKCVRRRMNGWQFTAPEGGSVNVAYGYEFS